MSDLADAVLPLIRTRSDLHSYHASNAHGAQMHEGIDILESAIPTTDPTTAYDVTHRALASALKVIMRCDDSAGIIGDACRRLIALHPTVAVAAQVPPAKLIDWMMKFQFDQECDFFTLDVVAYAPALGDAGVAKYRKRLDDVAAGLGDRPNGRDRWSSPHLHDWFTIERNEQRLAVLDHDIEAIIATHAGDRAVAAWFTDTAEAFEEIGEFDLAIEWAQKATDFDRGWQAKKGGEHWCKLLAAHRPQELLAARKTVFERWPDSGTAATLYDAAGESWPDYAHEVWDTLEAKPRDAVLFALLTLQDVPRAWELAHSLGLTDADVWDRLVTAYSKIDPLAVLPVHARLVEGLLIDARAQNYRLAARRLATMRKLAKGSDKAAEVDDLIAQLREEHRRRPRLQREFDKARLP